MSHLSCPHLYFDRAYQYNDRYGSRVHRQQFLHLKVGKMQSTSTRISRADSVIAITFFFSWLAQLEQVSLLTRWSLSRPAVNLLTRRSFSRPADAYTIATVQAYIFARIPGLMHIFYDANFFLLKFTFLCSTEEKRCMYKWVKPFFFEYKIMHEISI